MTRSTRERVAPVSIIVPCYRCADTIQAAVASVASQTLQPAELLLVDDCSGDGTLDILNELARTYGHGWISVHALERNSGPSRARNHGWEHATQKFVGFLDADDTWHPRKLERQFELLRAEPAVSLVATRIGTLPLDPPDGESDHGTGVTRLLPLQLLLTNPIPTSSVLMRRDIPFRFNESRCRAEDYQLWNEVALAGHLCVILNSLLTFRRKAAYGASGLSGDIEAMHRSCVEIVDELRAKGAISWSQWSVARASGALRYFRRRLILWWRDWKGE
jgi:glycosyltransferase involved in cell wall biosynthesis